MGRFALAGTSMVAAIPAGFVCYLFYTFLTQYSGNAGGGLQALAWGAVVAAIGPLVLPVVGFLTAGPSSPSKRKANADEAASSESVAEAEEVEEVAEAEQIDSGDLETLEDSSEFDTGSDLESGSDLETASSGEFEVFEEDEQNGK